MNVDGTGLGCERNRKKRWKTGVIVARKCEVVRAFQAEKSKGAAGLNASQVL